MSYCIIHKTTYHIAFYFLLIFNLHVTVLWSLVLNIINQNIVICNDCRPGGLGVLTLLSYVLGKV